MWKIDRVKPARNNAVIFFAAAFVVFCAFADVARAAFAWESIKLRDAVTDQTNTLGEGQRQMLEAKLRDYYDHTGNAFVLLIIPNLDGGDIDDAGNRIFEKSGIGDKGDNRGLLVLVSMAEHKIRIEVGYGLESYLTDAICKRVIDADMTPAFRQGRYYEGIDAAFVRMMKIAQGDASAVPKKKNDGFPVVFIAVFIIFFALVSIFGKRQSVRRGYYRGGPFIGGGGGLGGFSGGGGSFGGFGGGMSGGGGAHGGW